MYLTKLFDIIYRGLAKAFLKLGLERYHSVCIIGFNAPEWFYSDLGAIYAGGFAAGMYTTNSPEACLHCLVTSDANICVVEDDKQLEKILKVKAQCPKLKAIVQYEGKPDKPGVISWDELMELGRAAPDESLDRVLETIATNECCTLVYTSGTEGASKPVMLSHDNITFNAACIIQYFKLESAALSVISFLPLSHIAAQTVDIYSVMTVAATLWFADKNALKGSLINTLLEVRPHVFLAVPRVWEKIHEKLMAVGKQTTGVKRWIANYAKSTSLQHYMAYLEKVTYLRCYLSREFQILSSFIPGDKKKFLSMLLALRTKMNADTGEPLDELETDTKDWLKSLGVDNINTLSELLEKKPDAVYKATQAAIDRANLKSISNAQKIQKFEFLPADFSIPTGELGPTMKVKRPFVVKKYQSIIDKFYDV
ncbi:very long-chain-fatty-acid--CoA ligase bubblegum [Diaphorina citri]|uniref:long-chain-fatty-acid--CoA ligase n=1 Tax=Diaphorina citri TaxID=121845 RepID=A0A3Q0IN85_DIACI|nr:very long-chain-fatty-acid--CoA ligase bubblegum [Diaphorina citri]